MRGVFLSLALLAMSCGGSGPTEVVLVVDTDLAVPDEIDRIEITLAGVSGTPTNVVADLTDPGTPALPLTLTAFAAEGGAGGLAVTVIGRFEDAEVARWEARTGFISGETRMLYAILAARCQTISCQPGETCDQAGCRDVDIDPASLPEWDGAPPVLDGPACEPRDEACNLYDDDCDEMIDEGIDTAVDTANCGSCGRACPGGESCGGGYCDSERAVDIATGGAHTCVVRQSGVVSCWGWNVYGQVGDGTFIDRPIPRNVSGVSGATQVSAGVAHTCAVAGGDVHCWGDNTHGELGDGTNTSRLTPLPVGLSGISRVSAGLFHTCALTTAGDVACWGRNNRGQVGNGAAEDAPSPQMVIVGDSVTSVSTGAVHTCAAFADGRVTCWGANGAGQLGLGAMGMGVDTNLPTPLPTLTTAVEVALGRAHSCARLDDGTVSCWGLNSDGQLGAPSMVGASPTPLTVPMLAGVTGLVSAAAGAHVCAITLDGAACWGANTTGQVGDGMDADVFAPTAMIDVAAPPAAIGAGGSGAEGLGHTCLLEEAGGVRCVGDGELGQLGLGDFVSSEEMLVPVDLRL